MVQRYVLPWTVQFSDLSAGLALVLNAGHIAWSNKTAESICKVVWACSFALCQHGNISEALSSLEDCPFALSMKASERVLVITDHSADSLRRCWVIFEAALAHKWGKAYDICLPDDGDMNLWREVGSRLESLDVAQCHTSVPEDKRKILDYARAESGGIAALNEKVRLVARNAMKRAELMAVASAGDIEALRQKRKELASWRSIRGRTVTHIAAAHARVAALVDVLDWTGAKHLNAGDDDGWTPLIVAVDNGMLASVLALIAYRANLEVASRNGLTALHFATSLNRPEVVIALLHAAADIEAKGAYLGKEGHRPLTIAAMEGHAEIVRILVRNGADMTARTSTGASALHAAAWWGHADAAAALLTGRCEVDIKTDDPMQRTPLMLATHNCHITLVGLLQGAKACVDIGKTRQALSMMYAHRPSSCEVRRSGTGSVSREARLSELTSFVALGQRPRHDYADASDDLLWSDIEFGSESDGSHVQRCWWPRSLSRIARPGGHAVWSRPSRRQSWLRVNSARFSWCPCLAGLWRRRRRTPFSSLTREERRSVRIGDRTPLTGEARKQKELAHCGDRTLQHLRS